MEMKKSEHAQLGRKRGQFLTIGLIVALTLTISAFEWKSYDNGDFVNKQIIVDFEPPEIIPPTVNNIPKPPKPKVYPIVVEAEKDDPKIDPEDFVIDTDEIEEIKPEDFEPPIEVVTDEPFVFVEVMPEFEGGQIGFMKYIAKQVKYPRKAKSLGVEGKVFVAFVIDKEGNITEVKTIKGIGVGCDEEAERVIRSAPKWKPGKQRGKAVKVKMVLPIHFTLN